MAVAVGPVFTGGFQNVTSGDGDTKYVLLYLPDKANKELQDEGKPPVFYWMPSQVRLARKGDTGDYKFHLLHFVGRRSSETHAGVHGKQDEAGGVLSFTTTSMPPASVLEKAEEELLNRFKGKDDRYWGWRTPAAPMFRPMLIVSNTTSITNLSPQADGTVPALRGSTDTTGGGGEAESVVPTDEPGAPGESSSDGRSRSLVILRYRPPRTLEYGSKELEKRTQRDPRGLDPWYWKLQGQGPGSITPTAENAYSGLIGSLPAAILWQGFQGAYSPIAVVQALKLKVWSQALKIKVSANWERVFTHFSAHARGNYLWFSADIQAEMNKLIAEGDITVDIEIDATRGNAEQMKQDAMNRAESVSQVFMAVASKVIFDPPQPTVPPAQAASNSVDNIFRPYGFGVAVKARMDSTQIKQDFEMTIDEQYIQDHFISSSLEGFYEEIKKDPAAINKYFSTVYLDDWEKLVQRIVKPVVNWPDAARSWVGEPVGFLSVQLGYPRADGSIMWTGHIFQSTDTGDMTRWEPSFTMKEKSGVVDSPPDWEPDITYVKRTVHFLEPPGENDSPNMRVFVEKNTVDLDPGANGSPLNDITIEVRADSAGKLEVGPISLNVELENSKQEVYVDFKAEGRTHDGKDRSDSITRLTWKYGDQAEPRYWEIFTGQLEYAPKYKYKVTVIVKGSLFSKGMTWEGPWVDVVGNGPLMVHVPTLEEDGVTQPRSLITKKPIRMPSSTTTSTTTSPSGLEEPSSEVEEGEIEEPSSEVEEGEIEEPSSEVEERTVVTTPNTRRVGKDSRSSSSGRAISPSKKREDRTVSGYEISPKTAPAKETDSSRSRTKGGEDEKKRTRSTRTATSTDNREEIELLPRWRPA